MTAYLDTIRAIEAAWVSQPATKRITKYKLTGEITDVQYTETTKEARTEGQLFLFGSTSTDHTVAQSIAEEDKQIDLDFTQ